MGAVASADAESILAAEAAAKEAQGKLNNLTTRFNQLLWSFELLNIYNFFEEVVRLFSQLLFSRSRMDL